jgi:integrase
MAKGVNRLGAKFVEKVNKLGRYHDGRGLYLQVAGGKSWLGRFQLDGKEHWQGYGPYPEISLARAREKHEEARRLRAEGINPLEAKHAQRRAEKQAATKAAAEAVTFRQAAEQYIAAYQAGWSNQVHARQWPQSLADFVYPQLGDTPCWAITTANVLRVLQPIWTIRAETAKRVQKRIENVLDYAKTQGWRSGDNPAAWKGNLQFTLPRRSKVAPVEHHAALPWQDVPGFMRKLEDVPGMSALALRLLVLTACRSAEVLGAHWLEVDLASKVWTIPAARMKANREHRVPLSELALAVLAEAARFGDSTGLTFAGTSRAGVWRLLTSLEPGVTVHGFRSSFRDWAGETTNHPREVVEHALAHRIGDKAEQAYARGDLFQKRRRVMDEWAAFCTAPAEDKVIELRPAVTA